jgi:hypothetical protein
VEPAGATPLCETPAASWLPSAPGAAIFEEHLFAYDGTDVRGGYVLRHLELFLNGEPLTAAAFGQPTSEGIVDYRFKLVGLQVLRDAERRQPLLMGTGMGGWDQPVTRLLKSSGWHVEAVPFFFKVLRPAPILKTAPAIRRTALRRVAADAAAATGAARAGAWMADKILTGPIPAGSAGELVDRFGDWADSLWLGCRERYTLVSRRDSRVLNLLFPPGDPRFLRFKVTRGGSVTGWAVLMDTHLSNHKHFGSARVGLILDALAAPEHAADVTLLAAGMLQRRGVDMIRSHQSHPAWGAALRHAGFFPGPSYYLLGLSPQLARRLDQVDPAHRGVHVNRGDGDGPKHL